MGFTPQQVNAMSLYEFAACVDGWNKAQGGEDSEPLAPPTPEEYYDMVERLH